VAEQSEARGTYDGRAAIRESARAGVGLETARVVAGGVILLCGTDQADLEQGAGFRFTEPVTAELVAHVCDFYRSRGMEKAVIRSPGGVIPGGDGSALREAETVTGPGRSRRCGRGYGCQMGFGVRAPTTGRSLTHRLQTGRRS